MLLIDDVQFSPEDVAAMFSVNLKKVTKHGIFEINPKKKRLDRLNGGHRVPAGKNILCSFWVTDPKTKKSVNIRYAETLNQLTVGDRIKNDYQPRKTLFPGEEFVMELRTDRALFLFLSKDCLDSPFYEKGKPYYYFLQDKEAEAQKRVESRGKLFEAMIELNNMSIDKKRTLAKGLGISGVDVMEDYILLDALAEKAEKNPTQFINDAKSKNTEFYGTLQNLVDKGAIKFQNINGMDRWFWNAGSLAGQEIVHVEAGRNAFDVLKEFIVNNAQQYYKMIYDLDGAINQDSKLSKFLELQEQEKELQARTQQVTEQREAIEREQQSINLRKPDLEIKKAPVNATEVIQDAYQQVMDSGIPDDIFSEAKIPNVPAPAPQSIGIPKPFFTPPVKEASFEFQPPVLGHLVDPSFDKNVLPTDWKGAMEYIQAIEGKRPNNVRGKELLDLITSGKFKPE